VLRGLTLLLLGLFGLTSFVYGFGVLMSHGWESVGSRRVSVDTWQLMPPVAAETGIALIDHGLSGSFALYRYEVAGQAYLAPHWSLTSEPAASAEVHHLSMFPAIGVPDPHFPWASLFMMPLVCVLSALWVSRSGRISDVLRASAEARARLASRNAVMR
jgi:hypothetical protein